MTQKNGSDSGGGASPLPEFAPYKTYWTEKTENWIGQKKEEKRMPVEYLLYTICIFLFIINVMYYKSTKNPWRNGLIAGASGVICFFPVQMLLQYLGFSLAINYFTLALSVLLGIPGVILMGIYTVFF